MPFPSPGDFPYRNQTCISCVAGRFFTSKKRGRLMCLLFGCCGRCPSTKSLSVLFVRGSISHSFCFLVERNSCYHSLGLSCHFLLLPTAKGGPGLIGSVEEKTGASLVAQTVKCLPAMRETWVQSLGWEDPLEKEIATHSSILAWKIPWMEEPGRLQSMGSQSIGLS